jgi:hypothetical protein
VNSLTLLSLIFVAITAEEQVELWMPIDQVEMGLQIDEVIIYCEGDEC